ncbi:RuBisCO large subunit C-terminal-like domain-containing protein [Actinomycetospora endophytica]|uniref:RuBisCO large subunit C-terminal-like domain-containing protein n=1 Tax=Actinomycetospora endophytica TaxID=2291215 RepID=A0ABS8P0Y3_9PSEU|nr:RuBisCO large subunit C-terminal-like domain-containing protein [Actinomycetospora endophytica]MCD2191922.1 RuBisCO large subunit C-terminal-like domain-containing protein [Actinomycetospora endophytica]
MRDPRRITGVYAIESADPARSAAGFAGEQSSGTFTAVPGETDELRERFGAEVVELVETGEGLPSLPSRLAPATVRSARVAVEFPMENVGTDIATLLAAVAGNLFELGDLTACRLDELALPAEFVAAHAGPAYGVAGTRRSLDQPDGALIGTIVKPNIGLGEDEFRGVVRDLARAAIDLIKDDELLTDPAYLPLATRVRIATEEIRDAEQITGHPTMYAFNIAGDLAGLRARHDTVVAAGGRAVMLPIPLMGLPALEWLRTFAEVPIHGHRAGLAAQMRHPGLGVDYTVWQQLARLAGADHLHVGGLGSKFSETDDEVATNIRALQAPLGATTPVLPTLSSGQNVRTPAPTWQAVGSTDLLMLAGGGIIGHPQGSAAGVHSLRAAWDAAVGGEPLSDLAERDDAVAKALA